MKPHVLSALSVVLVLGSAPSTRAGETYVSINYQGQLKMGGVPVDRLCDFEFRFFDDDVSGAQIGPTVFYDGVGFHLPPILVADGLFEVALSVPEYTFDGNRRWLEVTVACPTGGGVLTTLAPRQLITPAPYAAYANTADNALSVQGIDGHSLDASDGSPTNALRVDADGEVGIGTGNPLSRLHVVGAENDGTNSSLRITSGTQNMLLDGNEIDADGPLYLSHNSGQDVYVGANGGNVGIGTTSPSAKLNVISAADPTLRIGTPSSNGDDTGVVIQGARNGTTTTDIAYLEFRDFDDNEGPAGTEFAMGRISGGMSFTDGARGDLRFKTNGGAGLVERMRILDNGEVGVGTAAPDNTLHVHKGSAGAVTANGNSPLVVENSTNGYVSILTPATSERGVLFGEPGNNAAGGIVYNGSAARDGLQFRTNGNTTRVVVDDSGRVGIGTTSPSQRLDVNGNLRVAGDLIMGTRTCRIRRGPFDFQPTESGKAYELGGVDISVPLSAAGQSTEFASALHLPEGARLTAMRASVEDTSASSEITVELWGGWSIDQRVATLASVAIPNLTTLSVSLNHVVDLSSATASYFVVANWTRPPAGLGDVRLRWVEVDFETDGICPPR